MERYRQYCPVAKAAELVTRRWMPLVVRELLCGSVRFNDIHRGMPRMSRSLLSRRLGELERAGIVERRLVGDAEHPEYHLTEAGRALQPIIVELGQWGMQWAREEVSREDLDAGVLMWDVRRRVVRERLPDHRVTVLFTFDDEPEDRRRYWLVLEPDAVDLCLTDPGHAADLELTTDVATLTAVWMGDIPIARALGADGTRLRGPRELRRAFPEWLGLSLFAAAPRTT